MTEQRGDRVSSAADGLSAPGLARQQIVHGLVGATTALIAGRVAAESAANLPPSIPHWSKQLGEPVGSTPCGMPSRFEENIIRRISSRLTTTTRKSSISFREMVPELCLIDYGALCSSRSHNFARKSESAYIALLPS
jgi:sulfane dehydrogenase subunit SoxC